MWNLKTTTGGFWLSGSPSRTVLSTISRLDPWRTGGFCWPEDVLFKSQVSGMPIEICNTSLNATNVRGETALGDNRECGRNLNKIRMHCDEMQHQDISVPLVFPRGKSCDNSPQANNSESSKEDPWSTAARRRLHGDGAFRLHYPAVSPQCNLTLCGKFKQEMNATEVALTLRSKSLLRGMSSATLIILTSIS